MAEQQSPEELSAADRKALGDLDILQEKMGRCDELLRPDGGAMQDTVPKSEDVMQVIGFLEACAPRMVELVEAAAQGALSEPVLMKSLEVNDRLTKYLQEIDAINLVEADAPEIRQTSTDEDFDAFLNDRTSGAAGDDLS